MNKSMAVQAFSGGASVAPSDAFRRNLRNALLAALAVRLLWAIAVPVSPISDGLAYDELARNLAFRNAYGWDRGELTAHWPVGTSFVYAILYRLFGHSYVPIVVMNIGLALGILMAIAALTRRWFGEAAAIAAAWIYALWPSQIQLTTILAAEFLFGVLVLGGLWAATEARFRHWLTRGVAVGVLLAAASFVRPQALLLPAVFALAAIWRRRGHIFDAIRVALVAAIVMAACIAPWSIRNSRLYSEPVLISTNGGVATWMGNNPNSNGMYMETPPELAGLGEAERDRVMGAMARDYIMQDPLGFVLRSAVKLVRTHDRETIGVTWNENSLQKQLPPAAIMALKGLSTLYWWGILLLALIGAFLLARRGKWWTLVHPALLVWGYFAAVHAVTMAADRYHFPSIPFIAALAGLALAQLAPAARRAGFPMWRAREVRQEAESSRARAR